MPLLPRNLPLFIPDTGESTKDSSPEDIKARSKVSVGSDALGALAKALGLPKADQTKQPIVFIGHGHGARIAHRLTAHVGASPKFEILARALLDIAPTIVQ
ncbi:hypothetical protein HOY80DRAFT_1031837 [Tuber brumale]|nr:hypothetical protein HOY80DRAFT_1031837 [Tuber brumale]